MAKPNLLLLVHVEDPYRHYFRPWYIPSLVKCCRSKKYSKIIHMTSMIGCYGPIPEIENLIHDEIEWAWGYLHESFPHPERRWVIPNPNSPWGNTWTWVPPQFRNGFLSQYKIFLGGGYKGECLSDMETILQFLNVTYQIINGYVYGD